VTESIWGRSAIVAAIIASLAGCSSISSSLGLERHVPDETQVVVRPALTLPPDFDLLPPGSTTPVSAEHETGASQTGADTAAQPKKEERGFFGRLLHPNIFGDLFDSDTPAKAEPAPEPQPPAPAAETPPAKTSSAIGHAEMRLAVAAMIDPEADSGRNRGPVRS